MLKTVDIDGVAKGSGMIHPNMATMLCFVATDAAIDQGLLRSMLPEVADYSLNMLTVDGDSSTNDSLVVLANGAAGNATITAGTPEANAFRAGLLARDGEGATHLLVVKATCASTSEDARVAARTIASSLLVKSAVYSADPNWGRLMAALGRSQAEAVEEKIDPLIKGVCIMEAGKPIPFHRDTVVALMRGDEVPFRIALNLGDEDATALGCDLTEEYVVINSAYTT